MRESISWASSGIIVLAVGAASAGVPPEEAPTKRAGSIIGRVLDLTGRPVAGARVWTGNRDDVTTQDRTGPDGRFRLGPMSDERPAAVWVESDELGLAREHFEEVRIFSGRDTDLSDVTLVPGVRLIGRFVDKEGRPVAGAEATISSWHLLLGHTITANGPKWINRGDDQGRFRSPALPAGKVEFTARAPGKALRYLGPTVEPGQGTLNLGDLRFDDEQPITGVVVDQDGKPIAGATVVVDADYDHPALSDEKGRFAVHDAAINAVWFLVEARGYFDPSLGRVHELKGQRTGLRIPLQKAYAVEGSVVDADTGTPVDIERVQLCTVHRDEENKVTLVG
jgi:uncharacterized GH25 family protein